MKNRLWSKQEKDIVRKYYPELGSNGCTEKLKGRTSAQIREMAQTLEVRKNGVKKWTTEEIQYLQENHPKIGAVQCSKFLNRTFQSVTQKASNLGLFSPLNASWPQEQIEKLKELYPKYGCSYLAKLFGCSEDAVSTRASRLGLKLNRSLALISHRECSDCHIIKSPNQFKKRKRGNHEWLERRCHTCRKHKHKLYGRLHYQKHRIKLAAQARSKSKTHKGREYSRNYARHKRQTDIQYKLKNNLRKRINEALRRMNVKKLNHTMDLVGCSIEQFLSHLKSQFTQDMSWENHNINGWHLDHIIPCSHFDLRKIEDQRKCFHYTNQAPRWATTAIAISHGADKSYIGNMEKGDKILA